MLCIYYYCYQFIYDGNMQICVYSPGGGLLKRQGGLVATGPGEGGGVFGYTLWGGGAC